METILSKCDSSVELSPSQMSSASSSSSSSPPISIQQAPTTRAQAAAAVALEPHQNGIVGSSNISGNSSFLQDEDRLINVGKNYQVEDIPDCDPEKWRVRDEAEEKLGKRLSICLWEPPPLSNDRPSLSYERVLEFCKIAHERCQYTFEQALCLLYNDDFDAEKALETMNHYRSVKEAWSENDKLLFGQAFDFNGKNFRRIRQMCPEKTVRELIEYYYTSKKQRQYQASMAEHSYRKRKATWGDDKETNGKDLSKRPKYVQCANCAIPCAQLQDTIEGKLCGTCFLYWRQWRKLRPIKNNVTTNGTAATVSKYQTNGLSNQNGIDAKKLSPPSPEDMSLNVIRFVDTSSPAASFMVNDQLSTLRKKKLKELEERIVHLRVLAHENRAQATHVGTPSSVRDGVQENGYKITHLKSDSRQPKNKISSQWSAYEDLLVIQGFRRYGTDFVAIANAVGNKTVRHIEGFYERYRQPYKLDDLIQECEAEKAANQHPKMGPEVIELDP